MNLRKSKRPKALIDGDFNKTWLLFDLRDITLALIGVYAH